VSCDQLLVREALAYGGREQAGEAVERMMLYVALVQPESELVDVAAKVLGAGA
jgi:hypothetical protein